MKLFQCQNCGQPVYFENVACERCGARLGFRTEDMQMYALVQDAGSHWRPAAGPSEALRFCANAGHGACNWLVPAGSASDFCIACAPNRTIPDLSDELNLQHWRKLEASKRHLFYSLLRLGLPLNDEAAAPGTELAFELIGDTDPDTPVLTGHADGLITINLAEADDAEREARRTAMGEPYRTLLGHFRHEIGHYYWDRLVRDGGRLESCRAMFGDERRDYQQALADNYEKGPPDDWRERFVSSYASAHPWEDFAETWAHYLHIIDTLETAEAFGLRTRPNIPNGETLGHTVTFDPYDDVPFDKIITAWLPLTVAVNSLNRSMGQPDLYPFVLPPPTIGKLEYIHRLVHGATPAD
ncbi:putative zinc-binding peptidase [Microbaculum marinum]|uniref:Zinc-binding peptidase n=1 Tax=Microbaculum marinum TaxID=1764581 RepID=A0AAW9RHL0_9HYPH